MGLALQAIYSQTVGAGGAASVTFNNIPQTFTDLQIVVSARGTANNFPDIELRPNGSTTNGSRRTIYSDSGTSALSFADSNLYPGWVNGADSTANTFSNWICYIPNYAGSNAKSMSLDTVAETNATAARIGLYAALWNSSSAITFLTILPRSGSFVQSSTFTLYGITRFGA